MYFHQNIAGAGLRRRFWNAACQDRRENAILRLGKYRGPARTIKDGNEAADPPSGLRTRSLLIKAGSCAGSPQMVLLVRLELPSR